MNRRNQPPPEFLRAWERVLGEFRDWSGKEVRAWAADHYRLGDDPDFDRPLGDWASWIAPLLVPEAMAQRLPPRARPWLHALLGLALEREDRWGHYTPLDSRYDWKAARQRVERVLRRDWPVTTADTAAFRELCRRHWHAALTRLLQWTDEQFAAWIIQFDAALAAPAFYASTPAMVPAALLLPVAVWDDPDRPFDCLPALLELLEPECWDEPGLEALDWPTLPARAAVVLYRHGIDLNVLPSTNAAVAVPQTGGLAALTERTRHSVAWPRLSS